MHWLTKITSPQERDPKSKPYTLPRHADFDQTEPDQRDWSDPRLPFLWATGTARLQASAAAVRATKPAVVGRQELGLPYVTTGLYGSSQGVQWKALIPDFRFFCETVILLHPEPFNDWQGPPVTLPSCLACCTCLSLHLLKVGEYQSVQSLRFWFNSNNTQGFPEASW